MFIDQIEERTVWTAFALFIGIYIISKWLPGILQSQSYKKKRAMKKQACAEAIRLLADKLQAKKDNDEEHKKIVSLSTNELVTKLQNGELKSTEVLEAYQAKALEVHSMTNALVEPIWEAEPQAMEFDNNYTKDKSLPLSGIPISIKDNYGIKGYDCTIGCSQWIDKPWAEDSVLIKVIKKQGGVPFVKTNVPQTMISFDTTNPIFGASKNPHNVDRSTGGSSGGEGALIGGGGSILGFGGDIGGSIRIPSSMCGVCGLKPTESRISLKGNHPVGKGQNVVQACYGPMARDVDGLVLAMRSVCVPYMWELDPFTPAVPFQNDVLESTHHLRIGFYTQDGFFHAVPSMERGVLEAKKILESLGHEVVPYSVSDLSSDVFHLWGCSIFGDQGEGLLQLLTNDAVDEAFGSLRIILKSPSLVKKIGSSLLKPFMPNMATMFSSLDGISTVPEWWKLVEKINSIQQSVIENWKKKKLDVVICPGFTCPALPAGAAQYASGALSYTSFYNVLSFPAGTLPITKVTQQDVDKMADYPVKDLWHLTVKKGQVGSVGLPVGVQVVALPWQDELVLRVMKELETALHKT